MVHCFNIYALRTYIIRRLFCVSVVDEPEEHRQFNAIKRWCIRAKMPIHEEHLIAFGIGIMYVTMFCVDSSLVNKQRVVQHLNYIIICVVYSYTTVDILV